MTQSEFTLQSSQDPQISAQCKRLLAGLRERGHMTSVQIWHHCGIWRGSARILDLRGAGFYIETGKHQGVNQFGDTYRCADYILHERR